MENGSAYFVGNLLAEKIDDSTNKNVVVSQLCAEPTETPIYVVSLRYKVEVNAAYCDCFGAVFGEPITISRSRQQCEHIIPD